MQGEEVMDRAGGHVNPSKHLLWARETREGLGSLEARQSTSHVGQRARTRVSGSRNQGREHTHTREGREQRLGTCNNTRDRRSHRQSPAAWRHALKGKKLSKEKMGYWGVHRGSLEGRTQEHRTEEIHASHE